MAIFGRGRRHQRAVLAAVTAAAQRFASDTEGTEDAAYRRRMEAWQERAWYYFNSIPEVSYAARYFANALSRITLTPALRTPESSEPVPLNPKGDRELGYTAQEAAVCTESLSRLRSPQGGQTEAMRRFGLNLFAPGDSLLFGRDDPEWGGERWDVYSTSQLTLDNSGRVWQLHEPPSSQSGAGRVRATFPRDETVAIRIWRSHGQYDTWADSPMRASEMILDELLVLTKAINAVATSRLAGPGIMFLPASLRQQFGSDVADSGDGNAQAADRFIVDLVEATAKTIADPGLASAQVPNFIFVPDAMMEQVGSDKLVQWSRELDEIMERQRQSLLDRWASIIDAPKEVMEGLSDSNHWSAWAVPEEAYRAHYAPAVLVITDGLTSRWHWPYLRERGVRDPERFVIGSDPSQLVAPPDQSKGYLEAWDRMLVSDHATRQQLGIGEDEVPDEDEIQDRLIRVALLRGRAGSALPETETPMPPGTRRQSVAAPPAALAAAADGAPVEADAALARLPETLGRMDAALMTALLAASDAALRRALERANQRLRTLAGRDPTLRDLILSARADALEVAPALGPAAVERLAAVDDLLVGAFDRLGSDYSARVGRAGEEAVRLAAAAGDISEAEARRILERLDEDRDAGWALLLAALIALAGERIMRPFPDDGPGEITDALVPADVVRDALVRAGGGNGSSMMTSGVIEDLFRRAGIGFEGFIWRYGDPSARRTVFEPHHSIDGLGGRDGEEPISGPDDPRLSLPRWPFQRWPKDHKGCLCHVERARAVRIDREAPTIRSTQEVA